VLFTAPLLVLASIVHPRSAFADVYDGNWMVLVITEKGTCDRGYRYAVNVANGKVRYTGDERGVNLAGTVSSSSHVNVSDRGAEGSGRISDKAGVGRWHGNGPNNTTCFGTWEAERR